MRLRGTDFGHVLSASGVMGFFGEGYPFHRFLAPFGLGFRGCTLVARTTTLNPRLGNLLARKDGLTALELKPKCIKWKPLKGVVLNAVSLSGPGVRALMRDGRWHASKEPFFLSFMAVGRTAEERLSEVRSFCQILREELPQFAAPIGLQVNVSCPNVALASDERLGDLHAHLDEYARLGIPIMPKLSVTAPPAFALALEKHPACDAICVSNTIPWGELPEKVDWKNLFGSDKSPLAQFGGGGLSGSPLSPIVADWIEQARAIGFSKPINAGGGILGKPDVKRLVDAGASSVFIGSMTILRGWRVQGTIDYANRLLSSQIVERPHATHNQGLDLRPLSSEHAVDQAKGHKGSAEFSLPRTGIESLRDL